MKAEEGRIDTVLNFESIIEALNTHYGFDGETFCPLIRTIPDGIAEMRQSAQYYKIGDRLLRRCISDGILPTISIGNRNYIALQSFMEPYSRALVYGQTERRARAEQIVNDMLQQMSECISARGGVPNVTRKRKK